MFLLKKNLQYSMSFNREIFMENEIRVAARKEELPAVQDFVEAFLEKEAFGPKICIQVSIAIEELFVNVAFYAYDNDGGDVTVACRMVSDDMVEITMTDSGVEFDPLARKNPDIELSADQRSIGGLGIFMVRKSMDDMKYERQDGHNVLKIYKSKN